MTLPAAALARLVQPLRTTAALPRSARDLHTLPIEDRPWRVHVEALARCAAAIGDAADLPDRSFNALRQRISTLLGERARAASMLLALEPFAPYDSNRADELLDILDRLPGQVATAVETGGVVPADTLRALDDASSWWAARVTHCPPGGALSTAFDMPHDPVDSLGVFRAELVLQHYAHRAEPLLRRLLPHLVALGVPYVTDVLAGISIVGRLLDCEDPVFAYLAVNMLTRGYLTADPVLSGQVEQQLRASEPALRHTEEAVRRALHTGETARDDMEARASAVAEAYKRTVEGPFRRFAWALHCLQAGQCSQPPTLGPLREQLMADGGTLSQLSSIVVLPAVRNSATHESLVWDGFADQFLTPDGPVPYDDVLTALLVGFSFTQGALAGLAAIRALQAPRPSPVLPSAEEEGRMPTADRVRGFFGTNRLLLVEARLNTPHAQFRVQRLGMPDINPCLQALLLARRLLPRTESFAVSSIDSDGPLLTVDAAALDAAMPAWEYAVSRLDQMPLGAFLPANYSARLQLEPPATALRAVAWIAADDAVGVIDGSPPSWDPDTRRLLGVRLQVVAVAIENTRRIIPARTVRLDSVHASVRQLQQWIGTTHPADPWSVDEQPALQRLRTQWRAWGPVPRLPSILEPPAPDEIIETQPRLRVADPVEYESF
ncbi:hypothetical protein NH287_13150 [Microbacterium sp. CnD16-F]|uniref:hypothetical protein n=1 Tax=Microbacterium sp. CnD16-F TaxID=2954493 RepID=UPI0020976563|nr:hypothetical protein [Microbacterium sp. CnD16-F]MCO7204432.1 hypothetical protein [Microbacterium sp. CnD16-F]